MIVVSDTTPLNYLILIGAQEILPRLFGEVFVPPAVIEEMKHPKAPEDVRRWAEAPPEWVIVRAPGELDPSLPPKLHRGEVEAISLAQEVRASQTLIDDWAARQAALLRGLNPVGTLNVLEEAACRDLVDIDAVVEALRRTNFWAIEEQYQVAIADVKARKSRKLAQEQERNDEGEGPGRGS